MAQNNVKVGSQASQTVGIHPNEHGKQEVITVFLYQSLFRKEYAENQQNKAKLTLCDQFEAQKTRQT